MAARSDPEDVLSAEYDDFEIQHEVVINRYRTDMAGGNTQFEPLHSFEPVNGLARDEVAELVALSIQQYSTSGETSANDRVQEEWELSYDSNAHLQQEDTNETEDFEGLTGFDVNTLNILDIDVLWHWYRGVQSQIISGSDSAGAGPMSQDMVEWVPYRPWFGVGPTADRHDELFLHFRVQNDTIDTPLRTETRLVLVWDVFDAPTR